MVVLHAQVMREDSGCLRLAQIKLEINNRAATAFDDEAFGVRLFRPLAERRDNSFQRHTGKLCCGVPAADHD